MSNGIVVGIIVATFTAAAGYTFGIMDDHRKREIAFVDQQIEKLYGPLLALSTASLRARKDLLSRYRPGRTDFFEEHDLLTLQLVEVWRRSVKSVFQPMNIKMEDAIINNAQLIEGGHIYPVFADLILHVESYKETIAKWKDDDATQNPNYWQMTENVASIAFPKGFDECVAKMFAVMRAKRERLARICTWIKTPFETRNDEEIPEECR
jgi:hypothetical protein